jgi:uncharacterized RDD family membrane protein YckC
MNCPVCNRNNAVTLSICPSCGAMINDSVREELKDKISPIIKPLNAERKPLMPNKAEPPMPSLLNKPVQAASVPMPQKPAVMEKVVEKIIENPATADISVKPTAPTLVEFHNKNATVPEWRLQLQNAVQQRQGRANMLANNMDSQTAPQAKLVTNGATALKPEPQPEPEPIFHANPTVNSALQRIQQSRRQFLVEEQAEIAPVAVAAPAAPAKNYPFRIATKSGEVVPVPVEPKPATINQTIKPKMVTSLKVDKVEKIEKKEFDTNKLPALPVKVSSDIHSTTPEAEDLKKTEIKLVETEEIFEEVFEDEIEAEEIEDLAPFAMRFNAGLFDLIIGSFLSFVVLTPFMITSGSWFTKAGFLAFSATCAVVMFIYMTVSIGLYGRTFGMRIFSLEVVDIEGEEYPSIHQAAVSSCLYLLSLALGGIGFLTLPFNPEKRAVHDLVSGTIVVKEI